MPKLGINVTHEMEKALAEEARKRGAPVASVVREAIKEFFEKRGVHVDGGVSWGGDRRRGKKEEE